MLPDPDLRLTLVEVWIERVDEARGIVSGSMRRLFLADGGGFLELVEGRRSSSDSEKSWKASLAGRLLGRDPDATLAELDATLPGADFLGLLGVAFEAFDLRDSDWFGAANELDEDNSSAEGYIRRLLFRF